MKVDLQKKPTLGGLSMSSKRWFFGIRRRFGVMLFCVIISLMLSGMLP